MPKKTTIKTSEETKQKLKRTRDNNDLKDLDSAINYLLESQELHSFEKLRKKNRELTIRVNEREKLLTEYREVDVNFSKEKNALKEKISDLNEQLDALKLENIRMGKQINESHSKIEKLQMEIERLSSDELIETLTQKNTELQKIVDSQKDYDSIKEKQTTMKEKIVILNEKVTQFERMEEEFKHAEQLLDDYERLKEEASQNPELRNMLSSQAKEIKYIKDSMVNEINRILEMDSMLNIKPELRRLKDAIEKKADFEMKKYEESFKGVIA